MADLIFTERAANSPNPLHILMAARAVVEHGIGGMERHCNDLCEGLAALGHDVTIVTTQLPKGVKPTEDRKYKTVYLPNTAPAAYTKEFDNDLYSFINRAQSQQPFDIIMSESVALGSFLIKTKPAKRPPVICILHGTYWTELRSRVALQPSRVRMKAFVGSVVKHGLPTLFRDFKFWKKPDCIVSVSSYVAKEMKRQFRIPSSDLVVIPNGIDLVKNCFHASEKEDTRRRLKIGMSELVLLCIGRMTPDKGFAIAVEAFAMVAHKFQQARLLLVGEGPEKSALEELVKKHHLTERVSFVGRVEQHETTGIYAASDVLIIPSIRYEGLPYTLIEGAAFGRAIITTRRGGQGAEIQNGYNGLLFEAENVNDCALALQKVMEDKTLIRTLGKNARLSAEKKYDVDLMVKGFEDQCYRLIKDRK